MNFNYKMNKSLLIIVLGILFIVLGCKSKKDLLPTNRFYQFSSGTTIDVLEDSVVFHLRNPLHCPLRFKIFSTADNLDRLLPDGWIQLQALTDSIVVVRNSAFAKADRSAISYRSMLGNPDLKIIPHELQLPIKINRPVSIMQSYNGSFSHRKTSSRHAIDFDMQVGDTIYAADAGRVVGIIKNYQYGGANPRWRPYANFVTVYNSSANWFTQYVHLQQNGVLVKLGDSVAAGDPVGIVGVTGYTSKEHLHFNVFKSVNEEKSMISIPTNFDGYGNGSNLTKGMTVKRVK
jgi:murein DD-endopeptidase MepM/ murein hydrolase activator NlpD